MKNGVKVFFGVCWDFLSETIFHLENFFPNSVNHSFFGHLIKETQNLMIDNRGKKISEIEFTSFSLITAFLGKLKFFTLTFFGRQNNRAETAKQFRDQKILGFCTDEGSGTVCTGSEMLYNSFFAKKDWERN